MPRLTSAHGVTARLTTPSRGSFGINGNSGAGKPSDAGFEYSPRRADGDNAFPTLSPYFCTYRLQGENESISFAVKADDVPRATTFRVHHHL